MKIVIIEDEPLTAEDLAETIIKVDTSAQVVAMLGSVKEAITYFKKNNSPDLIFSDIQLGDGLSFEIFKALSISTPVIFCTAFDEYALNAFKANGIDYVLKPFTDTVIADALLKYKELKNNFAKDAVNFDGLLEQYAQKMNPKSSSLLVYHKDKIFPVNFDQIALFYIENEATYLLTLDNQKYFINNKLEELEKMAGKDFYRANRQHLVNRKSIANASQDFTRKLSIHLTVNYKENITVSKEKITEFLNWLAGI